MTVCVSSCPYKNKIAYHKITVFILDCVQVLLLDFSLSGFSKIKFYRNQTDIQVLFDPEYQFLLFSGLINESDLFIKKWTHHRVKP